MKDLDTGKNKCYYRTRTGLRMDKVILCLKFDIYASSDKKRPYNQNQSQHENKTKLFQTVVLFSWGLVDRVKRVPSFSRGQAGDDAGAGH